LRSAFPADLGVVTSYFNPCGFRTRAENFERFAEPLRASGLPLVVVEAAFGAEPFTLDPSHAPLRVRGRDLMWQKERLLNLALAQLPAQCTKVVWLDADVAFEDPEWAHATSQALERVPIVQPFDEVVRLPRGHLRFTGEGERWSGFGAVYAKDPQRLLGGDFAAHGHTGFAWGARREVLTRHGLYDACIAGSGDHMMAHAFCGDWESPCIRRILGPRGAHLRFFRAWSKRLYGDVRARVRSVPGRILHFWHGETANRRYVLRNRELAGFDFDPALDVRVDDAGCWAWSSEKPQLHAWATDYFRQRREDDDGAPDLLNVSA
jgi:hypothetical protein